MSSVELKIESKPYFHDGDADRFMQEITLTYPREQLPLVLEGRVPLKVWQDTYDKLIASYRDEAEIMAGVSKWKRFAFVPCLLACIFPSLFGTAFKVNRDTKDHERAFLAFVRQQAAIYRSCGVKVTPAKELVTYGVGGDRHKRNKTVGLRFDVVGQVVVEGYRPPSVVDPTILDTVTRGVLDEFFHDEDTGARVY